MVDSGGIKLLPTQMECRTDGPLLDQALESYRQAGTLVVDTDYGVMKVWLYEIRRHLGGLIKVTTDEEEWRPRQHRLRGVAEPPWQSAPSRIGVEIRCFDNDTEGTLSTNKRSWVPSIDF